jgi:hypothetical protein
MIESCLRMTACPLKYNECNDPVRMTQKYTTGFMVILFFGSTISSKISVDELSVLFFIDKIVGNAAFHKNRAVADGQRRKPCRNCLL